jgi:hypothetical protein
MNKIATAIALALPLMAGNAMAEITQDCIVEGTVDKERAAKMGKPVYVEFHSAKNGEEARCSMNKRSNSRRVQFKAPGTDGIEDAPDGSKVKYRYTEDGNADGKWELLEVSGSRSS